MRWNGAGWDGMVGMVGTGRDGITPRIPSFTVRKSRSRKLIPNVKERFAEWDRIGCTASPRRNSGESFATIRGMIIKITNSN